MSHVATIDIEVKDLSALAEAGRELGLELVEGQKTYRWYGQSVGDYPLPEGFTVADLGMCEHALRVKNAQPGMNDYLPYEIGIVPRRDGRPGYTLLWDFYAGGFGLQDHVGDNCNRLKQEYALAVAKKQARAQGFRVVGIATAANGTKSLTLQK